MMDRLLESELHLALAQNGGLVRTDEPHAFGEPTHTRGPAIENAKLHRRDGELGDPDEAEDADQDKISGDFLADFLAEQSTLEVGQDSARLHDLIRVGWLSGFGDAGTFIIARQMAKRGKVH